VRRALTLAVTALLGLGLAACDGGGSAPTRAPGTPPAGDRASGTPATSSPAASAPTARAAGPIPDCVKIIDWYPAGVYRSVGPYPGETGRPESDLQYRYCNTAGYAASDGKVTLTTVITIYRPTTDPFRGIALTAWVPQRATSLITERCTGGTPSAWGGGEGGRRCYTESGDKVGLAAVAGGANGAVLRAEVTGKLPRTQLEAAADRIARAILTELK
jgi:hypothetical protein